MGAPLTKQQVLSAVHAVLMASTNVTNGLQAYGSGKAGFTYMAPENVSGNRLVLQNRSLEDIEYLGQNQIVMQTQWIDVELMSPEYVQNADWSILSSVNSLLHATRITSISGYLIDIIYESALPTLFQDVNTVRFQVEGQRFKVIIRPEDF